VSGAGGAVEILREGADDARLAALAALDRRDLSGGMAAELARVLDPAGRTPVDPGPLVWAHLPWLGALYRVLDKPAYRRVRLSRNREVIDPAEQEALGRARVGVVGLSVGHAVARTLALEGVGRFRLVDGDALELSNLNRVPLGLPELGLPKAELCARRLWELDPFTEIERWPGELAPGGAGAFVEGLDVVIDACDSFPVKAALRAAASAAGVPLIMETSFRGTLDLEDYRADPGWPPFHGALEGAPPPAGPEGRVAFFERLLGPLSGRVAQTLRGLGEVYVSYPQTASDVMLGGASVARLVRALVLGEPVAAGRRRVDLEAILSGPPENSR
jgi:hypothetical protein